MSEFAVETLELLQETAQKAKEAVKLDIPGDGRKVFYSQFGEIKTLDIEPPVRKHNFRRLDDLIAMAKLYAKDDGAPVIWHDDAGVVLVLNDYERRDIGTFMLERTPQLNRMVQLEKEEPLLSQKELVRLLRVVFELDSSKIAIFRKIDWSSSSTGQGTVLHGKESLGRSIEQQVKGAQDIPEQLQIPISLYRNIGEEAEYSIRCLVDFDVDASRIQIIPAPGQIDHALYMHQMNIRQRLEDELADSLQIYYGKP